jgi:integrase
MNRITLNWTIISRGIPRGRCAADDRAPTIKEIRELVESPDPRIKPIVYTMVSSGIRKGAWDGMRWKHITAMSNGCAKMIVYPGQHEGKRQEYYSSITPEAYDALKTWMDYRAAYGEKITGESWVMRDLLNNKR